MWNKFGCRRVQFKGAYGRKTPILILREYKRVAE